MPEFVTVERSTDLLPYDMLEEGRTIILLQWGSGAHMTTATVTAEHERLDDERGCLLGPHLEDVRDEPFPEFPVVVMRPGPVPERPCPYCTAVTRRELMDDGQE